MGCMKKGPDWLLISGQILPLWQRAFFLQGESRNLSEVPWIGQFIQGTWWLLGPPMSVDLWGRGQWRKRETLAPLQFIIIKYLLRMLEVVLSKDYLHITDCSPPSYSANLPHLIGISRTTIPLSPMRARYLEDGLNSIESTSNRGASVQTKICWQESMFSRSQCITQSACHFPTTNEYLH